MDFVFDGFNAFHSFGFLLMASVFTLIGGGIVGYYLYWMLKARTVKGKIKGIMVSGGRKPTSERDWKQEEKTPEEPEKSFTEEISDGLSKEPVATSFGCVFIAMFIGLPLIFVGIGGYMGYKYFDLKASGIYAEAKVIRNDSSYDSDSGTTYKAVLGFRDQNGRYYEVKDTISYGSSPSFPTGHQIGVYYNSDDPENFVIDDFWHNMAIAIAFSGFGLAFIGIFALAALFGGKANSNSKKSSYGSKTMKTSYNGENYYPVYEFRAPDGRIIEQISTAGRNGFLGKLPGESITLKVMPHPPYTAKKFSFGFLIFGMIFLAPGLYIGSLAIKNFEFNIFTILIPLAFMAFIAVKIMKALSKIPQKDKLEIMDFIKTKMKGGEVPEDHKFKITSSDNSGPKRLLEGSEIKERMKSQAKIQRITAYIMLLIAIGTSIGAYFAGEHMQKYVMEGLSAKGEVIRIESRYDSSSEGSGYTYYSVVEFKEQNGSEIKFQDSVGASTPMHERGELVDVLYLPENPQKAIIDRAIWNWTLSAALLAVSLLLLYSAFYSFRWANKYGGNSMRYRKRV